MAFNIISEIISVWNSGKQGGFGYEGRDEWEGVPGKWDLRKSAHHQPSQNALISSDVDPATEAKSLMERQICLACKKEREETMSLVNMWRPSGEGCCSSILRCFYDCMAVVGEEPQIIRWPECTHNQIDGEMSSVITEPGMRVDISGRAPLSRHNSETLSYGTPDIPEESVPSVENQRADILVHREMPDGLPLSGSQESLYKSALNLQDSKSPTRVSVFTSQFTPSSEETIELQRGALSE
ncbi:hypothetical protein [Endozoicomonas sp.]|uniref:hypothetical protein n=1 Tax=Endozoicomonas sp. TaxID=1892382 RepID=UPI003AF40E41